ncbi:MAG: response regulator [Planctomycetaceae bacterium]
MFRFSARTKLAFGLTSLVSTVLLASLFLKLLPDPTGQQLRSRGYLCDSIAISSSILMNTDNKDAIQDMLEMIVERNDQILSAGLRTSHDRELVVSISDHAKLWEPKEEGTSTDTHVFVPIYADADESWGNVEIRFAGLQPVGVLGWLQHPIVRLAAFISSAAFLLFFFYLGKTLEQLDPSQAVPSRVRSALDTLAESLLVVDETKRIMLTNSAFETLTGHSMQESIGTPIAELDWMLPESSARPETFPWEETLESSEVHSNVMLRLRVNDVIHTFVVNCSPVFGHEDQLRGVLITLEDVTQLEEKKREALAATEAKSLFLANMSHEIRTPMNAIIGFTDVLRRGIEADEAKQREYLDTIHSSGHHLIGLINDILDLSKIESGKLEIELRETSPHAMMLDVANVMQFKADELGLELKVMTDGPVPESVDTDPTRLRQILMNLMSNAVKFTEKGGVTITARMVEDGGQQLLAFDVTDTGIGIRADRVQQIFSPFVQADNTVTRRFGGTGLGLAISKQLATALGGELSATSVYHQGTTFTVTIDPGDIRNVQLLTIDEARPRLAVSTQQTATYSYKLPPAKILLADDGEANRQLASLLLTRAGMTVTEVENGADAVAAATAESFDLILMDMQMPIMDGWSATRALRQRGYEKPIVALTAAAMVEDAQRCYDAGCDDFLTKPIELDKLMAAIGRALGVEPELVEGDGNVSLPVDVEASEVEEESHVEASSVSEPPVFEPEPVPPVLHTETVESQIAPTMSDDELLSIPEEPMPEEISVVDATPIVSSLPTDDPEFREIVIGFVEKLYVEMESIRETAEAQDWVELAKKAHWLKGSAGTMGFHPMTEPARTLEMSAREGDVGRVASALTEVESIMNRISTPGMEPVSVS